MTMCIGAKCFWKDLMEQNCKTKRKSLNLGLNVAVPSDVEEVEGGVDVPGRGGEQGQQEAEVGVGEQTCGYTYTIFASIVNTSRKMSKLRNPTQRSDLVENTLGAWRPLLVDAAGEDCGLGEVDMDPGPHAVGEAAVRGDGRVEVHRGHHHGLLACRLLSQL